MKPEIKIIISMMIYGSLGIFVTAIPLPTTHIVAVRAALGCLTMAVYAAFRYAKTGKMADGNAVVPKGATIGILLAIGAAIGINWLLFFEAYRYTYVSVATLCYYTQPVFLIIIMRVFAKEKLTWPKLLGIAAALVGMICINGVAIGGADPAKGVMLAVASAVLYAIIVYTNKICKPLENIDSVSMTMYEMLGAAIVMIAYMVAKYGAGFAGEYAGIGAKAVAYLIILGIVHTGFAYFMYFSGMPHVNGQTLAVLGYIDPLSSIVFAAIFLGEKMGPIQLVGAVLILGGALFAQLYKPGNKA